MTYTFLRCDVIVAGKATRTVLLYQDNMHLRINPTATHAA